MVKLIAFLVIMAGFAYLINYFFHNSLNAFSTNGAYREMDQKSCKEVADALVAAPDAENRKKADIYMGELTSMRFKVEKMQENDPDKWSRVVTAFQRECGGNPGLPNQEVFQRITRVEIMGQTN